MFRGAPDLGQITETLSCVEASACMRTASGLGQQPCAESGRPGGSAYLCSGSPGASLGVSETEGLDKETAGTASVAGLSAGVLTGQPRAGPSLTPARTRGQGDVACVLTCVLRLHARGFVGIFFNFGD